MSSLRDAIFSKHFCKAGLPKAPGLESRCRRFIRLWRNHLIRRQNHPLHARQLRFRRIQACNVRNLVRRIHSLHRTCRRNAEGSSPTSCFLRESIGETILAHRTASISIMEWPTIGSARRALTFRLFFRQEDSPTRREQRFNNFAAVNRRVAASLNNVELITCDHPATDSSLLSAFISALY